MQLEPPPLQLGTAQWGLAYGLTNSLGRPTASEEIVEIIRLADAAGIYQLDTARAYGQAEAAIGRAKLPAAWAVTTKIDPEARTAEAALASLAASRAALGREHLEAVLLHRAEQRQSDGGRLWKTLRDQRDAGTIGRLGLSAVHPDEVWSALEDPDMEVIQVASSLFDQRLHRRGFFPAARSAGKQVVIRSLFLQGALFLTSDNVPDFLADLRQPLVELRLLAKQLGVNLGGLALAFQRMHPGTWMTLGCESGNRVLEYLQYWRESAGLEARVAAFMASLPVLPEATLNPAFWPGRKS